MTTASLGRVAAARIPVYGAIGFAGILAAASQFAIPVPGTPVPITLQPLVVVLAGLALGPAAAAASMTLYLLAGAAGLPVFAPVGPPGVARLLGPTGGYLLAYPAAAVVAGLVGARAEGGPVSAFATIALGVPAFVAFDALKALVAAALAGGLTTRLRR